MLYRARRPARWKHPHEPPQKINQLLKANAKKASAKLAPKSKDKYICKAERQRLADEAAQQATLAAEG